MAEGRRAATADAPGTLGHAPLAPSAGAAPATDDRAQFTLDDLGRRIQGELRGPGTVHIRGINAVDDAGPDEITLIADKAHARRWSASRACAAIVTRGLEPADAASPPRPLIFVADALFAANTVLALFQPPAPLPAPGVHPAAWVDPGASLGPGVRVGPHVSIAGGCVIGRGVVLHAGVRLYPDVTIGEQSVLHANCVVREGCRIGSRVILHQGVLIGADGFGYLPAPDKSGLVKVVHVGNVVLEDDVEIGAGTCIDRGKFAATLVGRGTKIDNLCQIAHNCRIGRACVIAGLTGLAGSVVIEDGVRIGGHVAINAQVRVGAGAQIGAKSGVVRDIPAGQSVLGIPAEPAAEALRQWAFLRKLPRLLERLNRSTEGTP